jgi:hypothetical protein
MTSRDFCYWLQGYLEIERARAGQDVPELNRDQVRVIKRHLDMVFLHEIDPSAGPPAHQATLDAAHEGTEAGASPETLVGHVKKLAEEVQALKNRPPHDSGPLIRC